MFVNGLFFSLIFVLMQITTLPSQRLQWTCEIEYTIVKKKNKINSGQVQRNNQLSIYLERGKTAEMKSNPVLLVSILCLVAPVFGTRINSKLYDQLLSQHQNHVMAAVDGDTVTDVTNSDKDAAASLDSQRNSNSIAYVKASIPIRIFQCMQHLSILKCMKIFILQRMERTPIYVNSGNLTADFLDQLLANEDYSNENILDRYYVDMDDADVNERLLKCFQRFFKDREIKLHFIPGMVVKVVPSDENAINLSLKRSKLDHRVIWCFKFSIILSTNMSFVYSQCRRLCAKEEPSRWIFVEFGRTSIDDASHFGWHGLTIHFACSEDGCYILRVH